jgi:hypothetical protein
VKIERWYQSKKNPNILYASNQLHGFLMIDLTDKNNLKTTTINTASQLLLKGICHHIIAMNSEETTFALAQDTGGIYLANYDYFSDNNTSFEVLYT